MAGVVIVTTPQTVLLDKGLGRCSSNWAYCVFLGYCGNMSLLGNHHARETVMIFWLWRWGEKTAQEPGILIKKLCAPGNSLRQGGDAPLPIVLLNRQPPLILRDVDELREAAALAYAAPTQLSGVYPSDYTMLRASQHHRLFRGHKSA